MQVESPNGQELPTAFPTAGIKGNKKYQRQSETSKTVLLYLQYLEPYSAQEGREYSLVVK